VAPERTASVASEYDRVVADSRCPLLRRVSSDLRAIQVDGEVTAAHARWLETDLAALAKGAAKPSEQSLHSLALDLAIALDDVWLPARAQARLVYGLDAVLSGAAAPGEAFDAVVRDVKDLLVASAVDPIEVELLVSDLGAIHGETTGPQPAAADAPPAPR
jgi:hypothetical protein